MDISSQIGNRTQQGKSLSTLYSPNKPENKIGTTVASSSRITSETANQPQISTAGRSLSRAAQDASDFLRDKLAPNYLPLSRNQELLEQAINFATAELNTDIDRQALREALRLEYNIHSSPPAPNPSANSGNVFDFLTASDRDILEQAYDFAIENNLDLENVELATGLVAIDRRRQAAEASGTTYLVHEPTDKAGKFVPQSASKSNLENTPVNPNPQQDLVERFQSGKLFSNNPFLNKASFINAINRVFNLSEAT